MTLSIDESLRFAIAHRRLIDVRYKGSDRLVEPHDYGVQKGKEHVLVYQRRMSGRVPGRKPFGWRMFDVALIERCAVMEETFEGSRRATDQHHYAWDVLYARVE
jgi:hypothetical protein